MASPPLAANLKKHEGDDAQTEKGCVQSRKNIKSFFFFSQILFFFSFTLFFKKKQRKTQQQE